MSHYHDSDDLKPEIAETALITAALRAGAAVTHGALALQLFDQARGNQR